MYVSHFSVFLGVAKPVVRSCRDTINIKERIILSPDYPLYPSNTRCEWILIVGCGDQIKLHFKEFELEQDRDFLKICESDITGLGDCKTYTGTIHAGKSLDPYSPKTNSIKLIFKSDFVNSYKGFKIQIEIIGKNRLNLENVKISLKFLI